MNSCHWSNTSVNSYHWWNTVADPLSLLWQFAVWHEDSSFDLAIGCKDNPQSMSVTLTSSACMPSWVMARRTSLSICMLPWVMARLCARDWVLVRSGSPSWSMECLGYLFLAVDWFGSLSWAWMGQGLSLRAWTGAGRSLSSPRFGRNHLSLTRNYLSLGYHNLTMCQMCSHRTRDISPCALYLRAGSRSVHVTRGIRSSKHSCPISLQVACIELVRCHTNMQLGNIGFT